MKDRTRRGPEEDKALSYARDHRNTYGENDKSSRKAIPRFKAASNRQGRHGVSQSLATAGAAFEESDEVRLEKASHKATHPHKRKAPDTPLGRVLEVQGKRRAARDNGKITRRKAREGVSDV